MMSGWTLDQWSNVITLLWMGIGFVYLAWELKARTKRWNGVGVAMTTLTLLAGMLYLAGAWNASVRSLEHLPGLPVVVRIAVRVITGLSLAWAIYKVRTVDLVAVKNIDPDDIAASDHLPDGLG